MPNITPCLWFDTEGEEAARFYTSVFPNSRIVEVTHYGEQSAPTKAGQVLTVTFELDGRRLIALNGGPQFKPNEALSLEILCETQDEIDHYWEKLAEGGEHGPCGWLKDRWGFSWQVVPKRLIELITDTDPETADRVMAVMLQMGKLEIAPLEEAAAGTPA